MGGVIKFPTKHLRWIDVEPDNCSDIPSDDIGLLFKHYPIAFVDISNWNDNWIWGIADNLAVFKNDIKDISTLSEYLKGIDDITMPSIIFLYDKDTIFDDDELILRGTYSSNYGYISYKYSNDDIASTNISSCSLQDGEDTYICDYYYD